MKRSLIIGTSCRYPLRWNGRCFSLWGNFVGCRSCRSTSEISASRWLSSSPENRKQDDAQPPANSPAAAQISGGPTTTTTADTKAVESILKAPFQKVSQPGLFPWRHEPDLLPRLIPGTPDFEQKGQLLGGNIVSSSPNMDALATEYFFLKVPWYKLLFLRRAWEEDLALSMQWAFHQAVPAMLSSVFSIPLEKLQKSEYSVEWDTRDNLPKKKDDESDGKEEDPETDDVGNDKKDVGLAKEIVESMVHPDLLNLYESAREHGKESLRVRLEVRPCKDEDPQLVSLFTFPFLSRENIKIYHGRKKKYLQFLDMMAIQGGVSSEAMAIIHEFMDEFYRDKMVESTVVCQVLIPCDEIFCVKDTETGGLMQGHADEKFRRVVHLVRFEQVVKTHWTESSGFLPFRLEPGNWQVTDIDDLLDGNLLL